MEALGELLKRFDVRDPEDGGVLSAPYPFNLMFGTSIGNSASPRCFINRCPLLFLSFFWTGAQKFAHLILFVLFVLFHLGRALACLSANHRELLVFCLNFFFLCWVQKFARAMRTCVATS